MNSCISIFDRGFLARTGVGCTVGGVCVSVLSDVAVICVTIAGVIGRAKRAPHWAVQLIFRVIYIYMYVGRFV